MNELSRFLWPITPGTEVAAYAVRGSRRLRSRVRESCDHGRDRDDRSDSFGEVSKEQTASGSTIDQQLQVVRFHLFRCE